MSPPAEQLIRDYLNRLSVAARGQLWPGDRRALVSRTRDFIERRTGQAGRPTAVEVGRLLAGLGDPAGLVQQERQRLAALHGETLEPVSGSWLTRAFRSQGGKQRGASWHWPVQEGSRADLQLTLLGGRPPSAPPPSARPAGADNGHSPAAPSKTAPSKTAPSKTGPAVPAQAGDPDRDDQEASTAPRPAATRPATNLTGKAQGAASEPGPPGTAPTRGARQPPAGAVPVPESQPATTGPRGPAAPPSAARSGSVPVPVSPAPRQAAWRESGDLLAAVVGWARRRPVEASAVLLLGLGGAIFPPVWLLGAAVALASRLWDYRDKWLGVAAPVLITIIGTVMGAVSGGHHGVGHNVHEAWVFADIISRVSAVAGAGYLGWRSVHGRRPAAVPPWNRPHKVG